MPCTALQPWRASFVQQCFRPLVHGNRLHPQQVAFCTASPYRSALPGAALRPAGSICAAMLSCSNATARIRCRLLSCSKSAAAFAALHFHVPHSALRAPLAQHCRTARRQNTSSNPHPRPTVPQSQRPAFAVSCSSALALHCTPALAGFVCAASAFARWCKATGCIRSRLPSVLQVWIYIQLHTDQHYQALHSALRAPFAQQCFRSATQQPAFAAGCSRTTSLQLHLPLFTARCRTPALKGSICTTCRIARRQSTRSSPHSRPAVQFASACIRSQIAYSGNIEHFIRSTSNTEHPPFSLQEVIYKSVRS